MSERHQPDFFSPPPTPANCRRTLNDLDALATAGVFIYFDCNYRLYLWKSAVEAIEGFYHINLISDYVFLTTKEVEVMLEEAADQKVQTGSTNNQAPEKSFSKTQNGPATF